jgi:hypothetical protein
MFITVLVKRMEKNPNKKSFTKALFVYFGANGHKNIILNIYSVLKLAHNTRKDAKKTDNIRDVPFYV